MTRMERWLSRRRAEQTTTPVAIPSHPTMYQDRIQNGEALALALFGRPLTPAEYLVRFHPELKAPPPDAIVRTASPLYGYVNAGKWIYACECGARGLPSPGGVVFMGYRFGWCPRCLNASTGRGWRPVVLPDDSTRRRIESVLLCRPDLATRNWEPSETVTDLVNQNLEHGDPIPRWAVIRKLVQKG